MSRKRNRPLYRHLADAAEIPKELSGGLPLLTMTGQEELLIENYKGIVAYTDAVLLLQTKCCLLKIEGRHLFMDYYTKDELKIKGCIRSIQFLEGGL